MSSYSRRNSIDSHEYVQKSVQFCDICKSYFLNHQYWRCQRTSVSICKKCSSQYRKQQEATIKQVSVVPVANVDHEARRIHHSLIRTYMEIINIAGNTPGVVKQIGPQATDCQVTECFLASSDHVARFLAKFIKENPLYKQISLADRCATFFQSGTRLKRVFLSAPATLNNDNFNRLCTLYPDFKVDLFF